MGNLHSELKDAIEAYGERNNISEDQPSRKRLTEQFRRKVEQGNWVQAPIKPKAETKSDSETDLPGASSAPIVRLDTIEEAKSSMPILESLKHPAFPDVGREATWDTPELDEGGEDPSTKRPRFSIDEQGLREEDDGTLRKLDKNSRRD